MEILLNALVAYLVVMDPLGVSMVFNGLIGDKDASHCRMVAIRAVALSFIVVLGFGLFGARLLESLGITMEAFRIAGGLLLFHTAFSLVVLPPTTEEKQNKVSDIVVFPLTFPLIAGPGCLTITILLFSKASQTEGGLLATSLAIVIILALMLVALLSSRWIARIIGETAHAVINRLLGVLMASLAIQFIIDGVLGLINHGNL